jgi:hypothetical protein
MNDIRPLLDHLESVLRNPDRGILGFVDDLVAASQDHDLQFGWQDGYCYVVFPGCENPDRIEVSLRKSVARAALARIAVLCNERNPDSVSPYGGRGEIVTDADPSKTIRAAFVNTPEALSLELTSVSSEVVTSIDLSHAKSSK